MIIYSNILKDANMFPNQHGVWFVISLNNSRLTVNASLN